MSIISSTQKHAAADPDLWVLIATLGHEKGRKHWDTRVEEIRELLDQGADPDAGRESPLSMAATLGHGTIAELLLSYGADIHGGCTKRTPLVLAGDDRTMGMLLMRYGAKETVFTAIAEGDMEKTKAFLTANRDLVHTEDERGMTPLFYAADRRDLPIMNMLLSAGSDPNAVAAGHQDISPIHCVCRGGGEQGKEAIALLVRHGVDLDACDRGGVTALHMAVRDRDVEAVQALLTHGADPDIEDRGRKSTPLRRAVANTGRGGTSGKMLASVKITALLLAHGADPDHVNRSGKPLTASTGNPAILALLEEARRACQ
jgi:ankyrin repeat protein